MATRRNKPLAEPAAVAPLADVFISYSHHDQAIARTLATTLRAEGFDVWFDEHIYAGAEWQRLLIDVINHAKAVLVLWSAHALASQWVRKEALIAMQTHRLVPVAIEALTLPPPFDAWQAALMPGWQGNDDHPELERLLAGLARLAPPSRLETVRPGFDTHFLPTEIALPAVTGVAEEFRYLHFSVVLNPARRLAWYVACDMARYDGPVTRGDRWLADPMLPAAFQPGDAHFHGTGLDRGHIVRARSVSWGSEREAALANRQAFFWTNTAPQHPVLNRHAWLALEQWEEQLVHARGRAIGFSGPRLAEDDPVHGEVEQVIGRLRVRQNFRLPRSFWKMVLAQDDGGPLQVAAFWLDEHTALAGLHATAAVAVPARAAEAAQAWRCSVADVEARTGIDFGATIREAASLPLVHDQR